MLSKMNSLRNPDGQLLLDFGKDNKHVYYAFSADGLYDALSSDAKTLELEMNELYSIREGISGVKLDANDPIVKRFAVLSDKYINKYPDMYREFLSGKKIYSEFSKFINDCISADTLLKLNSNQQFSSNIDQKIEHIYDIQHQDNADTTFEIFQIIKNLNKDLLQKTIFDSIQIYSRMYLHDGHLTKDLVKFKNYRNEEKFDMDDIFLGAVDDNFSKLFHSFFSDEMESFMGKQTENKISEDSVFTHFFTFVLTDVLKKLQEYVVLYKDKLNISNLEYMLENMKSNFVSRKKILSSQK